MFIFIFLKIVIYFTNKLKGKGAKIATVNLKLGKYNSGKLKGAKLYTVDQKGAKPYILNQNWAKVTSLLGRVKKAFSRRGLHHQ